MNSLAASRILLVLIIAYTATFSQSFSTRSLSSYQNLQFQQLQLHSDSFNDVVIHGPRDGRKLACRREMFFQATVMVTSGSFTLALLGPSVVSATTVDTSASGAEKFCGVFSDPVNHPGGTRTISLIDSAIVVGDYRLAQVVGGGGIGEAKEFVLPAVVVGDRAIIIDFSPKGGPRDFTGILEKDGSIKFLRDGNRWPRLT